MTEVQLQQVVANLRRWEGACPWMYLDNAAIPNVTVGLGMLLASEGDAVALPFVDVIRGQGATEQQIAQAFAKVRGMRGGLAASAYKTTPDLELDATEVVALAERRLADHYLPSVVELLPVFDALPFGAQLVTIDLAWNLGVAGLAKFRMYLDALEAGEWVAAALQSHVSTSRAPRNDWRAETLRAC